ncbi:MAG TPA: EI24 domain-containing protein [Acetobacteraceae bacterium]
MTLFAPLSRTLAQLDDPVFIGVVLRSVGWTVLIFAVIVAGLAWGAHDAAGDLGAWSWVASAAGGIGGAVLALFLFVPVATGVATLFIDRVAEAVEGAWYPGLPPATPAPLSVQAWDGVALGLQVLAMQAVALALTLLLPGLGAVLGWLITAWAIGRGLFVAVAMRRMDRPAARALYAQLRLPVLIQGAAMAAGALVPVLNLLVPVLGTAALVHVFHFAGAALPRGPNRSLMQ